jgi:hypothetical protein
MTARAVATRLTSMTNKVTTRLWARKYSAGPAGRKEASFRPADDLEPMKSWQVAHRQKAYSPRKNRAAAKIGK